MSELNPDLFDLTMSAETRPLFEAVKRHIAENVDPWTDEFFALNEDKEDRWSYSPRQLELLEEAKQRGHNAVCNVRFDTSDIGGGQAQGQGMGRMVVVMVSGTSYRVGQVPDIHMPLADFAMSLPTHS